MSALPCLAAAVTGQSVGRPLLSLLRVSGIVVAAGEIAVSRQVEPTPSQSGRLLSRILGGKNYHGDLCFGDF